MMKTLPTECPQIILHNSDVGIPWYKDHFLYSNVLEHTVHTVMMCMLEMPVKLQREIFPTMYGFSVCVDPQISHVLV
jgi:hypothetical protein